MYLSQEHRKWLKEKFKENVLFDEPMFLHTSFRIGGNADAYIEPENIEKLIDLIKWSNRKKINRFIKGDGTNLLIKDSGIRGITIDTTKYLDQVRIEKKSDKEVIIRAMAGLKTGNLCNFAIKHGYKGIEFAYGMPGTIGGLIRGNAGTSLGSIENILKKLIIITKTGEIKTIKKKDMNFSYRNFSFKKDKNPIIVKSFLKLDISEPEKIKKDAERILANRKRSQPLGSLCAGCFFKNPAYGKSAGALIELTGLKGKRIGDAQVSKKHANFIINRSNANAVEILELARIVRNEVKEQFAVELELEVKIVGE